MANMFLETTMKSETPESIHNLSSDFKRLESPKHTVDIPMEQERKLEHGNKFHFYLFRFLTTSYVSPPVLGVTQLGQYR